MVCSKAIILAGGAGTRWLPLTKAVDKCMVPIGNKPLIDWIVDDLIQAGITEIIFRVGKEARQLKTYYGHNRPLEDHLQSAGKDAELAQLNRLATKATYHFSPRRGKLYGTAVAVWQCRQFAEEGEKILVVSGDQLLYNPNGSATADFLKAAASSGAPSAMMVTPVPMDQVSKYGVVKYREQGSTKLFESIVEKPAPKEAPSNLNNATFFLFDRKMIKHANPAKLPNRNGEYYITDSLNNYVQNGNDLAVVQTKAEYLDCGTVEGWLHANNRLLGAN
jgi:UTP--glucose-1-phosphate uridylyltransferase